MENKIQDKKTSRRNFLRLLGVGSVLTGISLSQKEKALAGVTDNLLSSEPLEKKMNTADKELQDQIDSLNASLEITEAALDCIDVYVGNDDELHFVDKDGADTVLNFSRISDLANLELKVISFNDKFGRMHTIDSSISGGIIVFLDITYSAGYGTCTITVNGDVHKYPQTLTAGDIISFNKGDDVSIKLNAGWGNQINSGKAVYYITSGIPITDSQL